MASKRNRPGQYQVVAFTASPLPAGVGSKGTQPNPGNQTSTQGGGAYLFAYPPDEIRIDQTLFENNSVFRLGNGGALGGGLRPGNVVLNKPEKNFPMELYAFSMLVR